MQILGEKGTFLFTNVYSPQRLEEKRLLLENLTKLHLRHPNTKAIYGGDFNMITSLREKKGGLRSLNSDADTFISFIKSANLVDIHPRNGLFT